MKRIGVFLLLLAVTIAILGCNPTTDSLTQTTLSTNGLSDTTSTSVSLTDTSLSTTTSTSSSTTISTTISSSTTDSTNVSTEPESDLLVDEMAYLHSAEQQWYEFTLAENGYITTYTVGEIDTYGSLCTADYSLIATDSDNGFDTNFLIRLYLNAGTYYITVSGEENYYEGDYRVCVEYSAESDIDFVSLSDAYLDIEETDRYEIVVSESGYLVALTMSDMDMCGELYTADETELCSDDDGGYGFNFLIYYYLTPGTYYVDAYGYETDVDGDYQFIAFIKTGSDSDHYYAVNTEHIASAYDSYPITITEDGYICAYTLGALDTYGYLYTDDNTLIAEDDDSGIERNCQVASFVTAGTYYVVVTGYNATEAGDYRFVVDFEPANVYPHLLCEDEYLDSGDNDFYLIEITEPGYLMAFTVGDVDTLGYLYDSWYDEILQNDDSGGNYNFLLLYHVVPGSYYVCVSGYDAIESGDYRLIVDFVSDAEGGVFGYFFSAYGDTSVSSGDRYELTLPEPGIITIYTISSLDTYGYLYSSENVLLLGNDDSSEGDNFLILYNAEAGTYYIDVEGLDADIDGPYLLIVNYQLFNK
ncbi:MAG TPA: hypothetical protein PLH02_06360 [Bacillota bacterium]|nr:hypothetical protein [Bacillota bacterium]